jgi:hypothetical protein
MTQNLLGVVAEDFSYSLSVGTGLHLRFRKKELVKTEKTETGFTEEWKKICDDMAGPCVTTWSRSSTRLRASISLQEYDQVEDKESIRESAAILSILKYA